MNSQIRAKEVTVPASIAIPAPETAGGLTPYSIPGKGPGYLFKTGRTLFKGLTGGPLSWGSFEIGHINLVNGDSGGFNFYIRPESFSFLKICI
jgi:hypothetical protein